MGETTSAKDHHATIESGGLGSPSFQGLLWTQWLTSINDNVFRWFVIGVGKDQFTPENMGTILVLGSAFFTIPYIIFAPVAGWLADRYQKSTVIIGCKIAEIVIMALGVLAIALMGTPNPSSGVDPFFWLLLASVFLMGMQSALFAPAKVGTIPELLDERSISTGNGIFNLATLSATVIGMAIGGWLTDFTSRGQENIGIAAAVLIGIAVVGTMLSFLVRSLPAANPKALFPVNIPLEIFSDLRQLLSFGYLFRIALGITFFWSIAALTQLNLDVFSTDNGGLLDSDRTPLLIAVVLGIGLGSVLAGLISAGRIELGLVPLGAIGMVVFSLLLWVSPNDFIGDSIFDSRTLIVCILLGGLGVSAGFFDVPLASYLQHNSPIEKRGSLLSATNCLAFSGILFFFGLMYAGGLPRYEGSIDNLPAQMTSVDLSAEQKNQLADIKKEFLAKPIGEDEPGIAKIVASVDQGIRSAAITELVIADFQRRQTEKQSLPFEAYWTEFKTNKVVLKEGSLNGDRVIGRQIRKAIAQAGKLPTITSRQVFLVIGLMAIPVVLYSLYLLGRRFLRVLFYFTFLALYKIKITGAENIPSSGPAVAVANHSSWLDGAILLVLVPRIPRTIAWSGNFSGKILERFASFCGVILMGAGPQSIRRGLEEAREVLQNGEVLGIFPEGGISRECQVKTFKPGLQMILKKVDDVPIVPLYFDEVWGSNLSYVGGRLFHTIPWPFFRRPLSVHIGEPISGDSTMFEIRQAVQELSAKTMDNYSGKFVAPAKAFIKACKASKFRSKIADSTRQEETGGRLLTRALVLRRLLRREVLDANEQNIGILIPPSVGGAIVNVALALDKRVAINLNYSLSNELINHCVKDASIKTILTTKKVAEKFDFEFDCNVFYLDDLKDKVTGMDKAVAAFQSYALPGGILCGMLGLNSIAADDVLTIVFTSGSTGVPKGVQLTQQNVASQVIGIQKVASLTPKDSLIGVLPFFHSMGYTVTLWTPMMASLRGVYHFNPLDAKMVGKLVERFEGTIIVATPTFLRSYMRRCTPEQFKSLEMVIAGAERLPAEICEEFEQKFGVRPVEGYGTTELSPVAAVNIPYSRQTGKDFQVEAKEGTVGRPMPNCAAKVTDLETGEKLGPNEAGMLWIAGPNVMKGYLNRPDATAEVLVDGWYKTGDVALIDDDGFIKITGRMSRFSKIGGEMVPHLKIEEVLMRFLDQSPNDDSDDHLLVAVTAVPDKKKGERLIVLYTTDHKSPEEMQQSLKDESLPNIFIPSADSFIRVPELPILGTGKLDLRGIKDMALEVTDS
ncbi:MAG: MFS transporter [Planctomycetota bacterium]